MERKGFLGQPDPRLLYGWYEELDLSKEDPVTPEGVGILVFRRKGRPTDTVALSARKRAR
jgi:hypothetical protein